MKTIKTTLLTAASVLALSLFAAGCSTTGSGDYQGYSSPSQSQGVTDNFSTGSVTSTDPARGTQDMDNDPTGGVTATDPARGTQSNK